MDNEYTGGKYIRTTLNNNGEEETHIYHYGMSIIDAIADFCKTALGYTIKMFDSNSNAIAQALVKFYEYERMILDSVKWAYEKMGVISENGERIYK